MVFCPESGPILFVADFFQPVNGFALELFLNGNVRHRRSRRGAMPMFFAWCETDYVTGPNFFDGAAPVLRAPATSRDD